MEYRLNKIDPELRQRIKETTKSGKIHSKVKIAVNQDSDDKKKDSEKDFSSKLEKQKNKKRITIEAVKVEEVEIPAYKEAEITKDEVRGSILDVRK